MSTLVAKTIKGKRYYYAVESARVNGKPRIINQIYLGTLEKLIEQSKRNREGDIPEPDFAKIWEFGGVAALLDIAERLEVGQIIDECVGKRHQGLAVGDTIVLAAINRAVGPVSKNKFHDNWFSNTVLPNSFPTANEKNLSSQGFWNNMSLIVSPKAKCPVLAHS